VLKMAVAFTARQKDGAGTIPHLENLVFRAHEPAGLFVQGGSRDEGRFRSIDAEREE
jgi:hypothetical protein